MRIARPVALLLAVCGAALLMLNLYGLTVVHRNLTAQPGGGRGNGDVTITYEEALRRLKAIRSMDDVEQRLRAVTHAVGDSMAHYWPDRLGQTGEIRVPFSQNFILNLAALADPLLERMGYAPNLYGRYEFLNHHDALKRGVGLCSQVALTVAGVLHEWGTKVSIIGLDGHVVAAALGPDGREYLLDPDYNVVLPFDLEHAEQNPRDVMAQYKAAGYSDQRAELVATIYGKSGNVVFDGGPEAYRPKMYVIEIAANFLKWFIPVLLLIPWFTMRLRKASSG